MKRKGFTLLEILLAMAIAAMFSGAVYTVLLRAVVDTKRLEQTVLTSRLGDSILRFIERDLLGTLPAGEEMPHFAANLDSSGNSTLTLLTSSDARSAQDPSDLVRAAYLLVPEAENPELFSLLRRESQPTPSFEDSFQEETVLLAHNVKKFSLEFFDGSSWRPVWSEPKLPKAVHIELEIMDQVQTKALKEGLSQIRTFESVVLIPAGG